MFKKKYLLFIFIVVIIGILLLLSINKNKFGNIFTLMGIASYNTPGFKYPVTDNPDGVGGSLLVIPVTGVVNNYTQLTTDEIVGIEGFKLFNDGTSVEYTGRVGTKLRINNTTSSDTQITGYLINQPVWISINGSPKIVPRNNLYSDGKNNVFGHYISKTPIMTINGINYYTFISTTKMYNLDIKLYSASYLIEKNSVYITSCGPDSIGTPPVIGKNLQITSINPFIGPFTNSDIIDRSYRTQLDGKILSNCFLIDPFVYGNNVVINKTKFIRYNEYYFPPVYSIINMGGGINLDNPIAQTNPVSPGYMSNTLLNSVLYTTSTLANGISNIQNTTQVFKLYDNIITDKGIPLNNVRLSLFNTVVNLNNDKYNIINYRDARINRTIPLNYGYVNYIQSGTSGAFFNEAKPVTFSGYSFNEISSGIADTNVVTNPLPPLQTFDNYVK